MTRDEIVKAGLVAPWLTSDERIAAIERFAALVAAKEREDILRMSESQFFKTQAEYDDAIRARGEE